MLDPTWESFVDPLNDTSIPDKRLNTQFDSEKIPKALIAFWKISTNLASSNKSDNAVFRSADKEARCSALTEGITAILQIPSRGEQLKLLRQIQAMAIQCAGAFQENDIGIRRVLSQVFLWYLASHSDKRDQLVGLLVDVNQYIAHYVGEASFRPSVAAKLLSVAATRLNLPVPTRLALPGSSSEPKATTSTTAPLQTNHQEIGQTVNWLISSNFQLEQLLQGDVNAGLSRLLVAVTAIVNKTALEYAAYDDTAIRKSLKRFESPQRTKDAVTNIVANILYGQPTETRKVIKKALTELGKTDVDRFGPLFDLVIGFVKDSPAEVPVAPAASIQPKPAISAGAGIDALRSIAQNLNPFDRLCALYQSGKVNLQRAAGHPKYCHEVLCLILCGESAPTVETLSKGYKEWMHLVHPDKKPSPRFVKLAGTITEIGRLTRRELDSKLGAQALQQLFTELAELYQYQSVVIIPRKGKRRIVTGLEVVNALLFKEGFSPNNTRVILNAALVPVDQWNTTTVDAGDVLEIVTFE